MNIYEQKHNLHNSRNPFKVVAMGHTILIYFTNNYWLESLKCDVLPFKSKTSFIHNYPHFPL